MVTKEDVKDSVDLILDYLSLQDQKRIEIKNFSNVSICKRKFSESNKFYNTVYYQMPKNLKLCHGLNISTIEKWTIIKTGSTL